jgi:RND family efflux transporter MFP subunit
MKKILASLTVVLVASACTKKEAEVGPTSSLKIQRESISKVISVSGKVDPATKVVITAPLGNKIKNLNVALGQKVRKGQVLLEYDESSVLADVTRGRNSAASKRAELKNSQLEIEGLQKKLERAKLLFAKKVGSMRDVEDAERELISRKRRFEVSRAEMDAEKGVLVKSEESLKNLKVTSPINGIVISLWLGNDTFTPGTTVRDGEKLITVADADSLIVEGRLPEVEASKIDLSMSVSIMLESVPGQTFEGKILKIAPTPDFDQNTGLATFPIRITFAGDKEGVRIGMSAQCDIEVESKENVVVVPLSAVKNDGSQDYVEVVEDRSLVKRPISLGLMSDLSAEVTTGLQEGELVKVP